jgi:hypothetical protein
MEIEGTRCPKCGNKTFNLIKEQYNNFGVFQHRQCTKIECNKKYRIQVYQNKKFESNISNENQF